jgi:alkanesulfonate monooxygenase SsuD/methylene tetrahydromethanopterin reductase-like flavin-dependent oxidoreductase (luciferase family)
MRLGTFHLIGSPDLAPGERRVNETIEQIALADELGFDVAWLAEHHFSNYGYAVNPLLLIAKASALAPRIAFGQAVIVTPFWNPMRLAEDIALTDILTGGRLELGLGRGYQPMEFRGLNVPMDDTRGMFQEQLEIMRKAWNEDDFTYAGRHYQVPEPTTVLPRPIQRPHPPIWVATQSPETLDWSASQGYNLLWSANTMSVENLTEWRDRFIAARAAAGHPVRPGQVPIGIQRFVYVTETDDEARQAVWQTRWQRRVADQLRRDQARIVAGRNDERPSPDELSDEAWWDRLVYGTPERCIERLRRDAALGVTDLIGWFDVGGLSAAQVEKSMRLYAREVMPALAELKVG